MTYREAIQIQIKTMQEIYDNAEGLRDVAISQTEKEAYNNIRRHMPDLWKALQKVDNNLTDKQASYSLTGDYSILVNTDNV